MWPTQRLQRRLSYSDKLPKLEGMEPPRRCIREGITSINRGHCDASGHAVDIADGQTTHRWNRSRSLEPFGVLPDCSITTSRATDKQLAVRTSRDMLVLAKSILVQQTTQRHTVVNRCLLYIAERNAMFAVTDLAQHAVGFQSWRCGLTYQLRFSKTTGSIEFAYGSTSVSAAGALERPPQVAQTQMGFHRSRKPSPPASRNWQPCYSRRPPSR